MNSFLVIGTGTRLFNFLSARGNKPATPPALSQCRVRTSTHPSLGLMTPAAHGIPPGSVRTSGLSANSWAWLKWAQPGSLNLALSLVCCCVSWSKLLNLSVKDTYQVHLKDDSGAQVAQLEKKKVVSIRPCLCVFCYHITLGLVKNGIEQNDPRPALL